MEVCGFSHQLPKDTKRYLEHHDFQFVPVFHYHLEKTKLKPFDDELFFLLNEPLDECPGFIGMELESFIAPLLHSLAEPLGADWQELIDEITRYYGVGGE